MAKRNKVGYGLCYQGSKNRTAEKLLAQLPANEYFVDIFGGGGAMAHCACLSGKYDNVIYNEIDKRVFDLFMGAISGRWKDRMEWISRERFIEEKDSDLWVAHCYSFACNLRGYAYSNEYENLYEAVYYLALYNDNTKFKALGIDVADYNAYAKRCDVIARTIFQRDTSVQKARLPHSFSRASRINAMCGLNIQCYNRDYTMVEIPKNSTVYCDIPYLGTKQYGVSFSHKDFYQWALNKEYPVYISSYHISDNNFTCIWEQPVRCTLASGRRASDRMERLFVQNKFAVSGNLFS